MKMKEWAYRALRTFLQTAIGYIAGNIAVAIMDVNNEKAVIAVIATGVAAGLAAVMNIKNGVDEDADD